MHRRRERRSRLKEPVLQYNSGEIIARLDGCLKKLVQSVSFEIFAGESLALIGETGSGKTMVAQSIMGTLPPNVRAAEKSIVLCGQPLPSGRKLRAMLGRDIVYIPQNGHEFLNPSRTIWRHMTDSMKRMGVSPSERRKEACRFFIARGLFRSGGNSGAISLSAFRRNGTEGDHCTGALLQSEAAHC